MLSENLCYHWAKFCPQWYVNTLQIYIYFTNPLFSILRIHYFLFNIFTLLLSMNELGIFLLFPFQISPFTRLRLCVCVYAHIYTPKYYCKINNFSHVLMFSVVYSNYNNISKFYIFFNKLISLKKSSEDFIARLLKLNFWIYNKTKN